MHHSLSIDTIRSSWNLLFPGDTFSFSSRLSIIMRTQPSSSRLTFEGNAIYLVVSRRLGVELPIYKDLYVFMGPGLTFEEHLL